MESMITEADGIEKILGIIMAHKCGFKEGFKRFGENGEHEFSSDLTQLHYM